MLQSPGRGRLDRAFVLAHRSMAYSPADALVVRPPKAVATPIRLSDADSTPPARTWGTNFAPGVGACKGVANCDYHLAR